jgi:hypothetical protein
VNGDVNSFFTRKGYFGFGLQAFVGYDSKFLSVASRLCASSHDSTSYIVTDLASAIKNGELPSRFHVVLDEAYVCSEQELTPWKGRNLSVDKDSFNYYLSRQRQVVERAFGLLVQRWGIFWRSLRVDMDKIPLIIAVTCKLHNLCIQRFGTVNVQPYQGNHPRDTDVALGDNRNVIFTDGTGMSRGHRSDLVNCSKRERITAGLRQLSIVRPTNSLARRVERIRSLRPTSTTTATS